VHDTDISRKEERC